MVGKPLKVLGFVTTHIHMQTCHPYTHVHTLVSSMLLMKIWFIRSVRFTLVPVVAGWLKRDVSNGGGEVMSSVLCTVRVCSYVNDSRSPSSIQTCLKQLKYSNRMYTL